MGAKYFECSSKEMRGVDEVFDLAVNTVVGIEQRGWSSNGGGGAGGVSAWGKRIRKRNCRIL
jgi:hypothetical protein